MTKSYLSKYIFGYPSKNHSSRKSACRVQFCGTLYLEGNQLRGHYAKSNSLNSAPTQFLMSVPTAGLSVHPLLDEQNNSSVRPSPDKHIVFCSFGPFATTSDKWQPNDSPNDRSSSLGHSVGFWFNYDPTSIASRPDQHLAFYFNWSPPAISIIHT